MNLDWQSITGIVGVLLGGSGLSIFLDRKAKKKALEIENKKNESEVKKDEESYAMTNIKESYDKLEQEYRQQGLCS